MTIGAPPSRVSLNCNGTTKVFPVPLQAYQSTDFEVTLTAPTSSGGGQTTLVLNSDYSLATSGTLQPTQWTLTTLAASAYATGYTLQVFIDPVQEQQTSYVQGQAFPSQAVEVNVDRLTQMVQRLQDQVGRAIRAPDGDVSPLMLLPNAANRLNQSLMLDSNGNVTTGVPNTQTITTNLLAPFLELQQTPAEVAAGVTPVNYAYAPGIVDRYGTNTSEGVTDMSAAAIAACKCNQLVVFREGHTYNITNVQFVGSNITIDATGATLVTTGSPNITTALFIVVPQSLVTSSRITGADYPSNWKNGSTPCPTDGDVTTMMHENTAANRVQNVTFRGLSTSATLNGVLAYSVDGIRFQNCNMQNTNNSCLRLFHCTGIDLDETNVLGGSGTYVVFCFKCGGPIKVTARFNSSSASRQISFKGALHPPSLSIFNQPVPNLYTDMNARISVNISRGHDGIFFDTTPFYNADCNTSATGASGIITALGALTAGSGYNTPGTYTNVPLTGGAGTGATATITVAGGVVTAVTLIAGGSGYAAANTLTAADASIGGRTGGSAFTIPVSTTGGGTGVNAGLWYFQGQNFHVTASTISLPDAVVVSGSEEGRALWTSSPHQDVVCRGNKLLDATVFFTAPGFVCENNEFRYAHARGYAVIVNPVDTPTGITCSHYSVSYNTIYDWIHVGTEVALMQLGGMDANIDGNKAFNPDSSVQGFIGLNTLDYSSITNNVMSYSAPTITFIVSSGNTHGTQRNNKIVNSLTGAALYSDFQGSTSSPIPDGGTIAHSLISTPSSVVAVGTLAGTIVDVTAVSSINFTVSLKTWSGGALTAAAGQNVFFIARI